MPVEENLQVIVAVAGLLILLAWESMVPFFGYFRSKGKERGSHIFVNLLLGAANSIIIAAVFVALWALAATWSASNNIGLLYHIDASWTRNVFAVLLLDAWTYFWHLINHKIPFLWRFHRVHHSDNKMDVSTASRFHAGEIVLSSLLRIPLIAGLGISLTQLVVYETMMFAVVQFHHANIAIPQRLDAFLRLFIVTPAMHKVHHSRLQHETDSNYSAFLSIWDRLGRSFRMRDDLHEINFGLDGYDDPDDHSITGLARMPGKDLDN